MGLKLTTIRNGAALAAAMAFAASAANALVITPTNDAFALANTLFLNTDLIGNNVSLSGAFGQAGTYTNAAGTYGLPNVGIVLSSGNVADYGAGPNTDSGFTSSFGTFDDEGNLLTGFATPEQDALLSPITGQSSHFDVVQLDIEFFAATAASTVSFFAAFGSEEFPEFVGSSFIDGFGLFVNGVNVAGVLQTGGVAGDELFPVNINHPDFTPFTGTELNGVLAPNGNPVLRFDVPINPAEANTFTIILGDASDDALDTTVYLSSFFSEGIDGGGAGAIGQNEFNPVLPSNPADPETGAFVIALPDDVPAGATIWIDPPVSVGFEYEIEGGPAFETVTAPSLATVADLDGYFINAGGDSIALAAGATLDFLDIFGFNPTSFTLTGIDPFLMLDPADAAAFPLGVSLTAQTGSTIITVTPITEEFETGVVPLPGAAFVYLGALGLLGWAARRRAA